MDGFLPLILGWPAVLTGTLLLLAGTALRKFWLSVAGALLATGFCLYVAANPWALRWWGLLALGCNVGSVILLRKKHYSLAWLAIAPLLGVVLLTGLAVHGQ